MWKMALAMEKNNDSFPDNVEKLRPVSGNQDKQNVNFSLGYSAAQTDGSVEVCVPLPGAFMFGYANITLQQGIWNMTWDNCMITNCIMGIRVGKRVFIVK